MSAYNYCFRFFQFNNSMLCQNINIFLSEWSGCCWCCLRVWNNNHLHCHDVNCPMYQWLWHTRRTMAPSMSYCHDPLAWNSPIFLKFCFCSNGITSLFSLLYISGLKYTWLPLDTSSSTSQVTDVMNRQASWFVWGMEVFQGKYENSKYSFLEDLLKDKCALQPKI